MKEQEDVEELLNEAGHEQSQKYKLMGFTDDDIKNIIGEDTSQMMEWPTEYESVRIYRYNLACRRNKSIEDFDVMDIIEDSDSEESVVHAQPEHIKTTEPQNPSKLELFDAQQLKKLQFTGDHLQIIDKKFPTIKEAYGVCFPSVTTEVSVVQNWLKYNKISTWDIKDHAIFTYQQFEYQLFIVGQQLLCFHSKNNFNEPIVISPNKQKSLNCLAVSSCCRYFVLALKDQLLLYEIKNVTSMVLVKNMTDLKVDNITHIGFCGDKFERLYFVSANKWLFLVSVNSTLIFIRYEVTKMEVCLSFIASISALKYNIDADYVIMIAISNGNETAIYMTEPIQQLIHLENFEDDLIKARLHSNFKLNSVQRSPVCLFWRHRQGSKPQLVITYWNRVLIIKLRTLQMMPLNVQFAEFLKVQTKKQILSAGLLSFNHILLLNKDQTAVIAIPLIPSYINTQDESYISYKDQNIYSELRYKRQSDRQMVISDRIYTINLIKLNDYVHKTLVENIDHRAVFGLLLSISKQLNFSFNFSYMESDLTSLIFKSVETLLQALDKVDSSESIFEIKIYWICELLVESKRENILWGLVFSTLKKKNRLPTFFNCIEMFILTDSLHDHINSQVLNSLIPYYCEMNRQNTLLKTLLRVDFEQADIEKYLQSIGQKQMYTLYMYVFQSFTGQELDFFTPFVKLFSNLRVSKEDTEYRAMLCYWYLFKCFKGEKFPCKPMKPQERQKMVSSMAVEILNHTFLKRLIEIDAELIFQVLLLVYSDQANQKIISSHENSLKNKFVCLYPDEKAEPSYQATSIEYIKKAVLKIEDPRPKRLFNHFIALLVQFNPNIKNQTLFESIEYFLSQEKEKQCSLHMYCQGISNIEELLILMIRLIKEFITTNKVYLKRLVSIRCDYNSVRSYINYIGGDYRSSVMHLLEAQDQKLRMFQLIHYIRTDLQSNTALKTDFIEFLRTLLPQLLKINAADTLKIFRKENYDQSKLLREVRKNPQLRFQLLNAIIKDNDMMTYTQDMQQLLDHMELCCQLYPDQLVGYMKEIQYPLDEGIIICQKNNLFEAKSILQERSGDVDGALRSREQAIKILLKDKNKKKKVLKKIIAKIIQDCIEICRNHDNAMDSEDNNWITLLEIIRELQHGGVRQKVSLMVELEKHFLEILRLLFSFVPLSYLNIYFMSPKSQDFSTKVRIQAWQTLHRLNRFDRRMKRQVMNILVDDLVGIRLAYNRNRSKAMHSKYKQCCLCEGQLTEENCVIFNCCHISHKSCQKQAICLACQFQSDQMQFRSQIAKKELKEAGVRIVDSVPIKKPQKREVLKDVYVVELEDPAEAKRKQGRKLKKFDIDFQRNQADTDEYFAQYFTKRSRQ